MKQVLYGKAESFPCNWQDIPEIFKVDPRKNQHLSGEYLFRDRLINLIVIIWAVCGGVALLMSQARALYIGWGVRDIIQILIFVSIVGTALYRQKIPTKTKALILIIMNLGLALCGILTLGILSAGLIFFQLAAVIMAVFYSEQAVGIFVLLVITSLSLIGAGFISNQVVLNIDTGLLLTSPLHWTVYIFCIAYFFIVSCVTILSYRRAMARLINEVSNQRDKLSKSNADLHKAMDEIKVLKGILPLCSFCKKIRNEKGTWDQVEDYIQDHSSASISHGICPECLKKHFPEVNHPVPDNRKQ